MEDLFYPLGDCAVVVKLGHEIDIQTHHKVIQFSEVLDRKPFPGMVESVPAFTTVTVYYDPLIVSTSCSNQAGKITSTENAPYQTVCSILKKMLSKPEAAAEENKRVIRIPVCYGHDFGPDLDFVAGHNGIEAEEVIRIHTAGEYPVFMIGFAPGFSYLGGMSERIAAPRRSEPRNSIPAGSVGIAGTQTGIYSIETPGGWQLIGRTPLQLFQPQSDSPSLLRAGDVVGFYQISRETFDILEEQTS